VPQDTPPAASTALRPDEPAAPASEEETAAVPVTPATPPEETASVGEPSVPGTDVATVAPPLSNALSPPPALPEEIGPARLRDAALGGDAAAAFEVAARYAEGRGVLPDMPTAVVWYERAANVGLAPAQYRLGSIYEKGLGVPKDLTKAQEWYQRAADAGNVKAMHNLAVLYAEGAGGEPNLERAAQLFRMAAERGVRDSQFNLAILHARGLGVPQDLIVAYKWFGVAASSGDAESAKRRDIIGEALSDSDRQKAEEAVATFQPVPLESEANEVLMPEGGWSDAENSSSIQMSSETELIALVQKLLADNGFDPGPADGKLGRQTIDAISAFQSQAGLPETGQIDNALVAALQASET
jgi:localization factor PodJL